MSSADAPSTSSPPASAPEPERRSRRFRLRHVLFLALLVSGIIPLLVSNGYLIQQNRERLETDERTELTQAADSLSREVGDQIETVRSDLGQVGRALLAVPGPEVAGERLRASWVVPYLRDVLSTNRSVLALRVLDADGAGPSLGRGDLPEGLGRARDASFDEARASGAEAVRFAVDPRGNRPLVSLAVPVTAPGGDTEARLVVEALAELPLLDAVLRREADGDVGIFLIGPEGEVLWSENVGPEALASLEGSGILDELAALPVAMTTEYELPGDEGAAEPMFAQVSPVGDTGWSVLVHKPAAEAFAAVDRMVLSAVVATVLLVLLALVVGLVASRLVSRPIQRLAETSHEIAEGNFGHRVEVQGLTAELADLASDFNRMGDHVESYVGRLRRAAQANEDLFIGSIRAFAAAIDAKDPYTRGHSERVANLARTITRHLKLSPELQHKIWLGAVLHDVGKIGIEDRILRKDAALTDEEYEQMKLHTVIGAEIIAPIDQLREMVPIVRWHHEAWNGRGYPDGKKGEEIPLAARIVAVADTFDAITTNRPYQKAFTLEEAIGTIRKLAGSRFDARVVTAFLRAYESGEVSLPDPGPPPERLASPRRLVTVAPT